MAWVDGWHSGHLRASLGWDYGTRLINARRRDIEGCPDKASQDILAPGGTSGFAPLFIILAFRNITQLGLLLHTPFLFTCTNN